MRYRARPLEITAMKVPYPEGNARNAEYVAERTKVSCFCSRMTNAMPFPPTITSDSTGVMKVYTQHGLIMGIPGDWFYFDEAGYLKVLSGEEFERKFEAVKEES